ncbi:EspG family protein [Kibdelosporangium aridum]|uniref:EspG family protein n=1 Tax=Kibdelosporangium aridum TaxID=2030 RepID=A0A1Y5XTX5_KIBAR|nr:EspG family protein [Kibdelosporangium aridum]
MLPRPVRLPVDALATLLRQERIGELPEVLAPAAVWRPRDEVQAAQASAYEEAKRLGWLDRHGRLDVDVAAALSVLCRASVEYYGWIARRRSILAAATGREAILAVRDDTEISLRKAKASKLAEALVGQLPDMRPGSGTPVSVPVDELRAAARKRRPARPDLRQVLQVMAQPSAGSGELWVAVRDSLGRRTEVTHPLRYADTKWGRFLNLATVSSGGDLWLTVAPASPSELVTRLRSLERLLG